VIFLGKPARLDVFEGRLHLLAGVVVDDVVSLGESAVFGRQRRNPTSRQPALVHQVDDEFELVHALEVSHLRAVAGVDEGLVAVLDQAGDAATQDGLLAEEVGLDLLLERRLDDARAGAADPFGVGQGLVLGVARDVLVDSDEARRPLVLLVVPADG